MCNLINIHTDMYTYIHTYIHIYIYTYIHTYIPLTNNGNRDGLLLSCLVDCQGMVRLVESSTGVSLIPEYCSIVCLIFTVY